VLSPSTGEFLKKRERERERKRERGRRRQVIRVEETTRQPDSHTHTHTHTHTQETQTSKDALKENPYKKGKKKTLPPPTAKEKKDRSNVHKEQNHTNFLRPFLDPAFFSLVSTSRSLNRK
jgi:hypothetical protein